jgi:hypothetical protein
MSTALMPWTLGGEDDAIPHRVRYPGVDVAADRKAQPALIQLGGGIAETIPLPERLVQTMRRFKINLSESERKHC